MDDTDEFNEPYLPARYREVVRKKKQRRLMKKIGMIAVGLIAIVIVYVLLSGFLSGSPQPVPSPSPTPTQPVTTPPVIASPTTVVTTSAPATTIATAVPTSALTEGPVTEPIVTITDTPEPLLTARAGTYVTPKGDLNPKITEKQAQAVALTAFPSLPSGTMSVELLTSPEFGQVWKYTLRADTTTEASGLIDAESGLVLTFNRTIHPGTRSQNPALTIGNARQIADSTINSRNTGILSINMSDGRYMPLATPNGNVAGSYRFVYNRVVQDYPCDSDGFIVSIDAITGAVTEYVQRWQSPDNAFMIAEDATVPRFDALYTVQARAKSVYPSSISSLRILSSEVMWKDRHDPATIPRPATIPLAWKIVFDDDTIRAKGSAPGVAWVNSQTGDLIEMTYQH